MKFFVLHKLEEPLFGGSFRLLWSDGCCAAAALLQLLDQGSPPLRDKSSPSLYRLWFNR